MRVLSSYCLGGEIGRRKGLKIPRSKGRAGSTPAQGTINQKPLTKMSGFFLCKFFNKQRPTFKKVGRCSLFKMNLKTKLQNFSQQNPNSLTPRRLLNTQDAHYGNPHNKHVPKHHTSKQGFDLMLMDNLH